jgi:glycosyltransferase involved in cell wall biosynthesis
VRLEVDLSFDAVPAAQPDRDTNRRLDLHTLAAAARSPVRLWRLLRAHRYGEVTVQMGELPPSALQAVVLLSLGLVSTRRMVVNGRELPRAEFLARALASVARALPRELLLSAALGARLERSARRSYHLPRRAERVEQAIYLRVEPSLRWFGSQVGGAATHTSGVVNGLLDNGVEVRIFAAERPWATERAQFAAVPPRRVLQLVRGIGYADYSETILRAASRASADFVYQRYQLGSSAGLELARRLGVPLVLEFNGPEVWVERHWRSRRVLLLGGLLERLERRNLRDASLVVVVSEPLGRHVRDQGVPADRVLVNPNGVDVNQLAPYRELSAAQWRQRVGLADVPTVGFIGSFGPWHGVELLPALIESVPEAQWVLVGGGGMFASVRDEIQARGLSERVRLTGVLERSRALEMLSCSDVCVSPHIPNPDGSPFFGSPTKLFEYMGLCRAIVASDLDQIGEVIEDGRSGLLCPPGDVDAAAAAVRRLLGDAALRERLALGALRRAAERYSWSAHARRVLDALAAAPERAGGRAG